NSSANQNHLNSSFASGSRRSRTGAGDDEWEWTHESTRLRARQVLSLMVESLTQFFEENGLSNSTSHAVLDEQIYNLYILLQLALELTDLLLAQLVSTRRELETSVDLIMCAVLWFSAKEKRKISNQSGEDSSATGGSGRECFYGTTSSAGTPTDAATTVKPVSTSIANINFIRGLHGCLHLEDSFIITDAPMSPNHRIQAWDFSKLSIPDISNAEKNVVVAECKIHNDASVDVSSDGRLLVTLLPTGRLSSTAMLGVYSLEWESLGQCLYTTSFEQNAVSVSLSPASRHLLVGLASRRVALLPSDRHTMAQIFRLEGGVPGRAVGARGRLCHLRDIEQDREQGYMSLNCIRWAPGPGQGLVYGTNTGKLRVLR
ncbi:hypothetical protein L9F63_026388, partial [Diploptera punctata]